MKTNGTNGANCITGTTYMAACGLEASRRDSMRSTTESEDSFGDNVVKVMAQFAAEMIAVLDKLNARSFYTSKPYRYISLYCIRAV